MVNGRRYLVEIVWVDDANTPEQATAAAQQLVTQDGVLAIVGPPHSRTAIAAARVAESGRVPLISPTATNPEVTLGREYVFRATFLDGLQGYAMARFALNMLNVQRAAVLYEISNQYNRGLAEAFRDAFTELGGDVVAFEQYTVDTADFTPMLENIRQSGAEALFLPNFTDEVIVQGMLARELGVEAIFLGSDSWGGDLISPYEQFDGSYYSGHFCRSTDNPRIAEFTGRFQAAYDQEINGLVVLTYDAIYMILAAIQDQGEISSQAVHKGLYNIAYDGLAGVIQFDGVGDPVKQVAIWRINDLDRSCYQLFAP
jgi:branched-chain amino acid transport system substrate-binding protein